MRNRYESEGSFNEEDDDDEEDDDEEAEPEEEEAAAPGKSSFWPHSPSSSLTISSFQSPRPNAKRPNPLPQKS